MRGESGERRKWGEGKVGRDRKEGRNVGGGQNKHVSEVTRSSSHVGRTIKQAIKTVFHINPA